MIRGTHYIPPNSVKRRRKARSEILTVRRFQYHYAFILVSFGVMMSLVIGGATIYLIHHNYHLLMQTGLITAPRIVDNLERELRLAKEAIVGAYIGFVVFLGVLGLKFSHSIVVPVYLVQEKMRSICRGDLLDATVRIRSTDEFQEFAETYNYMVESLKAQVKMDIKRLWELKPDEKNRDAMHAWQIMLHEKESQLNGTEFSSTDPTGVSRHAS